MRGVQQRAVVLGFIAAGLLIAGLLWLVDVSRVGGALSRSDPLLLGVTLGFGLLWLGAWAGTLRTVLTTLDVSLSIPGSFFIYSGAVFSNNVTPFGQAGGEPIAALLIAKVGETRYETGLVGIGSVDVLNVITSIAVVFMGVTVYAISFTVGSGLQAAVATVGGIGVAIIAVFSVVWWYRERIVERLAGPMAAAVRRIPTGPVGSWEPTEEDVADRLYHFFGNIEVVAGDRQALLLALGFSTMGWLFQAVGLVVAFAAIGQSLPLVVAVFVIPLAYLAGMAPLPGGLGSIEAAFVALLVPTTGITAAVVTAAVLVFRLAMYWMPIVLGGVSATVYGADAVS